jgi:AcrR family transcriptional regulator
MRADARRNYDRILAAAAAAIAEYGVEAYLDEIARRVGSATLHRHFPSRQRLLEALFRDKVEALCATAADLAADPIRDTRWRPGSEPSPGMPCPAEAWPPP